MTSGSYNPSFHGDELESNITATRFISIDNSYNIGLTSLKLAKSKDFPAMQVIDVSYKYPRSDVCAVKNVSLSVPEGQIYGLLGPSGCGKTTLINCIINIKDSYTGRINIFGHKSGSEDSGVPGPVVGYMPQELGLFPEFTIEETLTFFCRIYKMPQSEIEKKIDSLVDFLQIPEKTRRISQLSGGQKRRVSLAVAIAHNPKLLILDEPTVGVDPLLREAIWKHFTKLSQDGMTILITTHYIEESRSAGNCAFMRDGEILKEGDPEALLQEFQKTSMEDVFLHLCHHTEEYECLKKMTIEAPKPNAYQMENNEVIPRFHKSIYASSFDSIRRVGILVKKNLLRLWRNGLVFAFSTLMPAMLIIMLYNNFGNDPVDLPVALVNNDRSRLMISNMFINSIDNKTINLIHVDNLESAFAGVRRGDYLAAIEVGENFTKLLFEYSDLDEDAELDEEWIKASGIKIYADTTATFTQRSVIPKLYEAFGDFMKLLLKIAEISGTAAIPTIYEMEPIYGTKDPPAIEDIAPGFLLAICFMCILVPTTVIIVLDRGDGLYERSLIAGVKPFEFMLSHVVVNASVAIIQAVICLVVTFLYGIPCRGSFAVATALVVIQAICAMAGGTFIASFCTETMTAFTLGIFFMFFDFFMSGIIWPKETMPAAFYYVSICLPQSIAIDAMKQILYKAWDLTMWPVQLAFMISGSWTLFLIFGSGVVFTLRKYQ